MDYPKLVREIEQPCETIFVNMATRGRLYLAIVVAVAICGTAFTCSTRTAECREKLLPRIEFDDNLYDFGKVSEGIEIRHAFKVFNRGGAPLKIGAIITSCGCTAPSMAVKTVQPGKSEKLEVVMNTSLKQGPVKKEIEVYSNDPATPKASIFVAADVKDLHLSLTAAERARLFQGKCGFCHWKMGLGLEGEDLYKADCGMCHGEEAQGGVGPALAPRDYGNPDVSRHVTQITSYGSKTRITMPGYLEDAGGPLTDKEIASIVHYLSGLSEKTKK